MKTDEEIIRILLSGQNDVYRELVSRYKNKVFSVAYKVTHQQKDAEDITQEVFIQAYRTLASFNFNSSFSTWLYRVAMNKSLDWKRKNKEYLLFDDGESHDFSIPNESTLNPEEALLQKDKNHTLHLVINNLPDSYKSVVRLYYFDHLTYEQIAVSLGIAKKTVESRLYRARAMLKEEWIKEGVE